MTLSPEQDAFGAMLRDAYHGLSAYEVIERDDGFVEVTGPGDHYLRLPRRPDPGARELLDAARGRVLDVGCGAGRFAVPLQRRGHDVLGTDISPGALEVAALQGFDNTRLEPITAVGPRLGRFDTVLLGGNNFGLMQDPQRARRLLGRFHRITGDDGRVLAQSLDVHQNTAREHVAYRADNRARGRMPGQIRMRVRYKDLKTPFFDYLMVSEREMAEIADGTGWRIARTIALGGAAWVGVLEKV
ncbi:MAG: class I SAM-dependent methyltransferase [Myxococcales bacterium]|jgi:SAM-dependent methyltransferase